MNGRRIFGIVKGRIFCHGAKEGYPNYVIRGKDSNDIFTKQNCFVNEYIKLELYMRKFTSKTVHVYISFLRA